VLPWRGGRDLVELRDARLGTRGASVLRDPDTRQLNIGCYRGMLYEALSSCDFPNHTVSSPDGSTPTTSCGHARQLDNAARGMRVLLGVAEQPSVEGCGVGQEVIQLGGVEPRRQDDNSGGGPVGPPGGGDHGQSYRTASRIPAMGRRLPPRTAARDVHVTAAAPRPT
jgi:hypothetical protein